jgi:hypothetical protein
MNRTRICEEEWKLICVLFQVNGGESEREVDWRLLIGIWLKLQLENQLEIHSKTTRIQLSLTTTFQQKIDSHPINFAT